MSLRTFHLIFILLAIVGADLFGLWAVRYHIQQDDPLMLALGIISFVGGIGLIVYAYRFVKSLDRAGIR
jgi:type IV secretory pathway TrbL component